MRHPFLHKLSESHLLEDVMAGIIIVLCIPIIIVGIPITLVLACSSALENHEKAP